MNSSDYYLIRSLGGGKTPELKAPGIQSPPEGALQHLNEVLDHLDAVHTVTLDIFDTLLRRDVAPATQPQRETLQLLSLLLSQLGFELDAVTLGQWRSDAEALARQQALEQGGEAEVTLSEIMASLYELLAERLSFKPEKLLPLEELVAFEVEREMEHTSPMPGARELLEALNRRNIRVVLISDMHLEPEHLTKILSHHGLFDGVDAMYVSCAVRHSKGSGGLFAHLIEKGVLTAEGSLHIGDHPVSDRLRPAEHGIDSRLYHNPQEQLRRAKLNQAQRLAERFGDTSHLRRLAGVREFDTTSAYQIGYQRLGPIFTLFALDVLDDALRHPCREIFFLARDGFLIQQLYQKLRAGLHHSRLLDTPEGSYLYLSRASTRLATLKGNYAELLTLAQRVNRQDGSGALLSLLGLQEVPELQKIVSELRSDDSLQTIAELQRLLLDTPVFREQVEQAMTVAREQIYTYLLQHNFFNSGRVMLVDIGWNGSILATLEKLFGELPQFPEVRARLFGRRYGVRLEQIVAAPGFAYDEHRPNPVEQLINEASELFETVAASSEGSALGYAEEDGVIVPLLAESSGLGRGLVEELQQGILGYCEDFVRLYNRFGPPPGALKAEASIEAASLILGNSPEERALLAALPLDIGWGREETVSLEEYLGSTGSEKGIPQFDVRLTLMDTERNGDLQRVFEAIQQMLERLHQEQRLIVYGVGTVASVIAPALIDRIAYFVDGNRHLHGREYLGKTIHPPERVMTEQEGVVVVTPLNRKHVIGKRLRDCPIPALFVDDFFAE